MNTVLTNTPALSRNKKLRAYTFDRRVLAAEIFRLRSFVIGLAGQDGEGDYRPEFVERLLKAAQAESTHTLTSPAEFLKQVKSV